MTRINLLDPSLLSNKHLVAEHKEITRIFTRVRTKPVDLIKIPESYRMGTGHVTFFYDKLGFIKNRYLSLVAEMHKRGYSTDSEKRKSILQATDEQVVDKNLWKEYTPTQEALSENLQRLQERDFEFYKNVRY